MIQNTLKCFTLVWLLARFCCPDEACMADTLIPTFLPGPFVGRDFHTGELQHETELEGTDFSDQDLSGSRFEGLRLRDTNFKNTKLNQVLFDHCDLTGCTFDGADFRGCSLFASDLNHSSVENAVINDVISKDWFFSPEQVLVSASYRLKDLSGVSVKGTREDDASQLDLGKFNLMNSRWDNVKFKPGVFAGTKLKGITIKKCVLGQELFLEMSKMRRLANARLVDVALNEDVKLSNLLITDFRCSITEESSGRLILDRCFLSNSGLVAGSDNSLSIVSLKIDKNVIYGLNLTGIDLRGENFLGRVFVKCTFNICQFSEGSFVNATLIETEFNDCSGR